METTIKKHEVLDIKGITHIIFSEVSLGEYEIKNSELIGKVIISIEYFKNTKEELQKFEGEIEYKMIIEKSIKVEEIKMDKFDFSVIDNQGVEMNYELKINLTEIEVIEEIKDSIKEEYEEKIQNFLEREEDEEIVYEEETNEDEKTKTLFPKLEDSYLSYKVIFINSADEIEEIAAKYNKTENEIYEENNYVIKDHVIIQI